MVDIHITDPVVNELTFGASSAGPTIPAPANMNWDCSIGDLNFLYAISDQNQFIRQTAQFRRQRIDTERNPGEQSLDTGYWLRSQQSWHLGSGLQSAEPLSTSSTESGFRYAQGGGVDPWTPGQLSLLNDTSAVYENSGTNISALGVDTGVIMYIGYNLYYVANDGTVSGINYGSTGTSPIVSMTSNGAAYVVTDTVNVFYGLLPSGAGSIAYNLDGTGKPTVVRWVKNRVMLGWGKALYELASPGPTLPTPLDSGSTRPNGWQWVDMAAGPAAIYVTGYANDTSTIEKITLNTSVSGVVTLNTPVTVVDMPRGEIVQSIYQYVGAYLIVGTNAGVRVAAIADNGDLTLGPLLIAFPDGANAYSTDAVAIGSYAYVTVWDQADAGDRRKRAGLYRINLGANLDQNPLSFPVASDLTAPVGASGQCNSVTVAGGKLWFTVKGAGLFRQNDTFVDEGWLETGRIRLGTLENKGWRDVRVILQPNVPGSVTAVASVDGEGAPSGWQEVVTASLSRPDITGKLTSVAPEPATNLFLAFHLQSLAGVNASPTRSPVMIGYQLRAVPAPERTRLLQVPLLVFDYETDRKGQKYGDIGLAYVKLQLLEQLEETAALVQWRDYNTGEAATAYVEEVRYNRTNPPTNRVSGNGGIATVQLRLV